jgi:hypothetical protein
MGDQTARAMEDTLTFAVRAYRLAALVHGCCSKAPDMFRSGYTARDIGQRAPLAFATARLQGHA